MRTQRAFTLIEVLVVVAVISILAALLFPIFSQAREKARQASCASNTRQVGLAILMYAESYDETLPPVAYEGSQGDVLWLELVAPYVKNQRVFQCPSDGLSERSSYGLNELAFGDLTDSPPGSVSALAMFQAPAQTVMLGDTGTGEDRTTLLPDTFKLVAPSGELDDDEDARPAARHSRRVNLSFMDGHQQSMPLEQFYASQSPTDRWFQP
jgi:prepilin-type N-terminal cleavage/methylation domain-containing protein/prepilin-type processing-associated H-X9-DG protein